MNISTFKTLEFDKIINLLMDKAISNSTKEKISNLRPYISIQEVNRHLRDTTDAKAIIEAIGEAPLSELDSLYKSLSLIGKGTPLSPEQLTFVANFLTACKRLKGYLERAKYLGTPLSSYGESIDELKHLRDIITDSIRGDEVDDKASTELYNLRRKIENLNSQVRAKLDSILKKNKDYFSDFYVTIRNGRLTLPLKKEYRHKLEGSVVDISQSGGTIFFEPSLVKKYHDEIHYLKIEEDNEIRKILFTLTNYVEDNSQILKINAQTMETLDFVFAKARLSIDMNAVSIPCVMERSIHLNEARHPLLPRDKCVPLDFELGNDYRGLIITGPNTGGKTVALKTIGLLSIMAQCGLHVPATKGHIAMFNSVCADIGDGQSISENLSTFSSHMSNIIDILSSSDNISLILLDELGSGTDPSEGMGLAVAIIEELIAKGCLFVATSHYPELKEFARITDGIVNGRMEFDLESLRPKYILTIGQAGESCALHIAKRLGLMDRLIARAKEIADNTESKGEIVLTNGFIGFKGHTPNPLTSLPKLIDVPKPKKSSRAANKFEVGDSVTVYPQKKTGIVYALANEKGEVGVQIHKKKELISHKRLKLKIKASELYPDNYDLSIVLDTVSNRKNSKIMNKRHDPRAIIVHRS